MPIPVLASTAARDRFLVPLQTIDLLCCLWSLFYDIEVANCDLKFEYEKYIRHRRQKG
jgi:hypothetical protein